MMPERFVFLSKIRSHAEQIAFDCNIDLREAEDALVAAHQRHHIQIINNLCHPFVFDQNGQARNARH